MAIKSISQLDRFDNNTRNQGEFKPGDRLRFFGDNFLTDADEATNVNQNWINNGKELSCCDNSYWSSLFEISKPVNYSSTYTQSDAATEYESQSLTYQNLMENIIWDVKAYLNARNNLNDYDLLSVIEQDYTFTGNKTFANKITVNGYANFLSSVTIGDDQGTEYFVVNADSTFSDKVTFNNLATFNNWAKIENLSVHNWAKIENLSVHNNMRVSCDIVGETRDIVFDGWSFGLVDRENNTADTTADKTILSGGATQFLPTYVGTNGTTDSSISISLIGGTSLSGESNRTGDPVCFVRGRPWELTAVNYAMSAYNLVDRKTSRTWNVGNGTYRSNANKTGDNNNAQNTERYSAVYFKNGKPYTTNVIKYAECAYWSDLGEKYLADNVYEPGTLVKFGGEKEITIADTEVNAIVSTKAFELNNKLIDGTVIALCGRVPTKVKGKIQKFDKVMLSDTPGIACKWDGVSRVIGRALENSDDENIKLVECVTRFEI